MSVLVQQGIECCSIDAVATDLLFFALLRYEIFEVQLAVAIPQEKFQFLLGDIPWTDETTVVLEQLTQLSSRE